MIKKLSRLKQCGIFQDFSWPAEGLGELLKFNLIFGWNGTGKSTLSRILRQLELRELPEGEVVHIECDAETVKESEFTSSTLPIKVFNRDFVDESVEGELKPINVFGKKNIDRKKELDKQVKLEATLRGEIPKLKKKKETAGKSFERMCTDAAKGLKVSLGKEGNSYATYDKRKFKTKADALLKLTEKERQVVDGKTQQQLLTKTRSVAKEAVSIPAHELPDIASRWSQVAVLRKRAVVAEAIKELSEDSTVSSWVQDGVSIHTERDSKDCFYCGQLLPKEREAALERHFNDAVKELQDDISDLIREIEAEQMAIDGIVYSKKAEIVDHLATTYTDIQKEASREIAAISKALQSLKKQLAEKEGSLFEKLDTPKLSGNFTTKSHSAVISTVEQHNEASNNFAEDIASAQKDYEKARVIDSLESYESNRQNSGAALKSYEEAVAQQKAALAEIKKLRAELVSHQVPAKELTSDLAQYLGHKDLTFDVDAEGYTLSRRGKPAKRLSDGEKTAIAVLYFLKTFSDESFKLEESIVVFDDPISSLDSNAIYNAFAFIKDRSSGAKQFIVLTHSFLFFRMVRTWFHNLRGQDKKNHRILMLTTECTAEGRKSSVTNIDPLLNKFNSEYQYLFGSVYRVAYEPQAAQLDSYLPAPNIARRVLEAFLAFKAPMQGDGSFHAKLDHVEKNPERKTRIYRFVNMQSHLDAVGDADEDISWLSETPAVLQDILALIEETDAAHYNGMVNYISSIS